MKNIKNLLLISCSITVINCAAIYKPDVWDDMEDNKIHTLRLYTGSKGECLYVSNFEKKAKETCKNGYEVLEKTREPKTLHPKLHSDGYYTWVIRCK